MTIKTAAYFSRPTRAFSGSLVEVDGRQMHGRAGDTLQRLTARNDGPSTRGCLGRACHGCAVRVLEGAEHLVPVGGVETLLLTPEQRAREYRLECQARLRGSGDVKVQRVVPMSTSSVLLARSY